MLSAMALMDESGSIHSVVVAEFLSSLSFRKDAFTVMSSPFLVLNRLLTDAE